MICNAWILLLGKKGDILLRIITLKCMHFTYILCRLFVYILLTFYVFSSLLFSKILFRLSLMVWSPCLFLIVIFHRENDKILQIFSAVICVHSTNIN